LKAFLGASFFGQCQSWLKLFPGRIIEDSKLCCAKTLEHGKMQTLRTHPRTRRFSKKKALGDFFRLLLITIGLALPLDAREQVTLTASDGVKVYGDFYPATSNSQPYILLFHQAGSNRAEYAPIAPRLVKLGFNCLAIDQRSGGDLWGQQNETVHHIGHNGEYSDVLKDMEAALAWARSSGNNGRVLVWGSSYSAALVFLLAAEHREEVAGVLGFSPGEYLDSPHTVHEAAAKVIVPIFVTSAKDRDEIAAAKSILAVAPARQKTQFVPHVAGVHGSSTLREDKNRAGESENWRAAEEFLARFRAKESKTEGSPRAVNAQFVYLQRRPDGARALLTGSGEQEQIQTEKVSDNYFSVLNVPALVGHTFSSSEMGRGANLAVLSYGMWKRRFASAPEIVGQTLEIDNAAYEVLGVMAAAFEFPEKDVDVWLPIATDPRWHAFQTIRIADAFGVVGRLKSGVSPEQAQADMAVVSRQLAQAHAATDADLGVRVVSLAQQIVSSRLRLTLWLSLGAVLLVVLIACSNVAGLFLARTFALRKTFAIRLALGAGRSDILQQVLAEALLFALGAGTAGVLLAALGIKAVTLLAPAGIPHLEKLSLNGYVLAFAIVISLLAAIISALAPAWRFSGGNPQDALRDRVATGGREGNRMRGLLVFVESALAIILLSGTGLLLRSSLRLAQVDLGFRPDHLVSMHIDLPGQRYTQESHIRAFVDEAIRRVSALPGVKSAAIGAAFLPRVPNLQLVVEGRPESNPGLSHEPVTWTYVSEGFSQTMGIPLIRGRFFSTEDGQDSLKVVVINQTMARKLWPGEDPIGKRFKFGTPGYLENATLTVVGVVGDAVQNGPETPVIPVFYFPVRQRVWDSLDLMVRTVAQPAVVAAAVGSEVHAIDKTIPRSTITTVERHLWELGSPRRFQIQLFGLFSFLALALAAAGIYGVMAYAATRRTNEIGIRMALGAQRGDVVRMMLREGLSPVLLGLVTGLSVAMVLTRLLRSFLFGISPGDPVTYVTVATVVAGISAIAAVFPIRRAICVDPLIALRHE
jgi:putative ABC transport system permease protein